MVREEVCEYTSCEMPEDLAIGQRAIDRGPHRSEVPLPNTGFDWRAGELAIWQFDAVLFCRDCHLAQILGTDLMAEAT